ncbi:MAG: M20 family metallopeptidase [Burkholderiaceae bacterium]|jgi:hippurate hydrolase|nr:M20 family metallopeptidase [Burkholderiaceae bacterium]
MGALVDTLRAQDAEFVALRRDIHQHPEMGFAEHRTAALVADRLQAWGYEVERGIGGTGLVGTLRRGSGTRRLGIRAEMDALPIVEATGLPWASAHPGVMHACGHDGHTTMLVAAAKTLAERGDFDGTLHLIFTPAEEGLGGARRMIEEGLFERYPCDAVFAMHNMPGIAQGRLEMRVGAAMASGDSCTITLRGTGGHGALPHHARDPVVATASLVMALQTIVSRNVDPQQVAVVTVGAMQAGTVGNVIPHEARLELTVRALDRVVRRELESRTRAIAQAQAEAFGVQAEVDWRPGYPVLVNTPAETALAGQVAVELLGAEHVNLHGPAITASEDFAFMLDQVPGCYLFIGNGAAGTPGGACMVHNPGYDFNDDNIAIGAAYWVALARRFLT